MGSTLLPLVGLVLFVSAVAAADLRVGFYDTTCPEAESIVRTTVQNHVASNNGATAWLLRMYFHDCFYTGCDASLLIRTNTDNQPTEQDAHANKDIDVGDSLIDDAKSQVEAKCPQTVSCADILALSAREAVFMASGGLVNYSVPTGRRDSLTVTTAKGVNVPEGNTTVADATRMFQERNFTVEEMVTLLGGHSIGVAYCEFFRDRLYNFNGKNGTSDPTMDSALMAELATLCQPQIHQIGDAVVGTEFVETGLDQGTPTKLDNVYYQQLLQKKGILQIDQELANDESTAGVVKTYASNATLFYQKFAAALIKLGNSGVLTGDEGDIRKSCDKFNTDTKHRK